MPTNRKSGRQTPANLPPTSRRSARQQRIANREANRNLSRAGTRGSSGGNNQFLVYTAVAVVIAVVVIAAAFILSNQKGAAAQLGAPNAPAGSMVTSPNLPANGRTLGNPDAKVTVDLWEDYQCTACWTFTHDIEPQIDANYVATGKAKIVFHDYLTIDSYVAGAHESLDAANAALCAVDQGKFWQYHDWLFANQYQENSGAFTKDRLKSIAAAMGGLDLTKFNTCVDNGAHDADVNTEQKSVPSGSHGTPTVVVNGTLLGSYDYASIAKAIDGALGVTPSPSVSATATPAITAAPSVVPSAPPSVKAS
jgi:protein-disulfide isomerase